MNDTDRWQRKNLQEVGDSPFIFIVVYGITEAPATIDARRYRTRGLPKDVGARSFDRTSSAAYLQDSFEEGYAWQTLVQEDPELSARVASSPGAVALAGDVADATSLEYLRDVIGATAALLDHGGVAVYDPFTFRWWRPLAWKAMFFEPDQPHPRRHVMIYHSEDHEGIWLHTRGLLTFGRPDLSVRAVQRQDFDAVAGMCNELIDFQAYGGLIVEGQVVRHPTLGGFVARHAGDRDDPDFNNVHVQLIPVER